MRDGAARGDGGQYWLRENLKPACRHPPCLALCWCRSTLEPNTHTCTSTLLQVTLDADMQAPELLSLLFQRGAQLLLSRLPEVWEGRGPELAWPQDEAQVLHAAKV